MAVVQGSGIVMEKRRADLTLENRLTLSNMAVETRRESRHRAPDRKTFAYLRHLHLNGVPPCYSDDNAVYADELNVNVR